MICQLVLAVDLVTGLNRGGVDEVAGLDAFG